MPLPLELGGVQGPDVRRAFEQVSTQWPTTDAVHSIGATNEPAFQGAWVNFGAPWGAARFYRFGGRAYLSGAIKSGVINTVAFTLPLGYRPVDSIQYAVPSNGAFGVVIVDSAGVVTPAVGSNASVFLDGINFRVA